MMRMEIRIQINTFMCFCCHLYGMFFLQGMRLIQGKASFGNRTFDSNSSFPAGHCVNLNESFNLPEPHL